MIRRMAFDPVVTGSAHLSCAGQTDAEAVALFRGERAPETPRPACDLIDSAIRDQVFYLDSFQIRPAPVSSETPRRRTGFSGSSPDRLQLISTL